MVVDVDAREGQPVQRRVPHRRSHGADDSGAGKRAGGNGLSSRRSSEGHMLPTLSFDGDEGGDAGGPFVADRDGHAAVAAAMSDSLHASFPTMKPSSIWYEIWFAIREGMWYVLLTTAVGAALSLFAVVHLTSHENGRGAADTPRLPVRRIPPAEEQAFLHDSRMRGATTIQIDGGGRGGQPHQLKVILQGATIAPKEGHLRLPDQFYQGVHFGVSAWDSWGEQLADEENSRRNDALRETLEGLSPKPTAVYPATFEGTVEGFVVAFLAGALSRQKTHPSARERSDPVWAEAEGGILAAARRFQQLTVMKWHPKVWGPGHEVDENLHTSVLQDVLPTRTGLRKLASTVAVYRVAEAVEATGTTT
ncbi:unnamed protein product, partial [Scytosiphon promiscuus]